MTTIIPSLIRRRRPDRRPLKSDHARRRAFTLVEVMVGATLSVFVLAGVLSTFLFLTRSGANLRNYSDMTAQARKGLEQFAEDIRQASAITWASSSQFTVTVNSVAVQYTYDSTAGTFSRTSAGSTTTLLSGIQSGTFSFKAYNVAGSELALDTAANLTLASNTTKQLQISLQASRTTTTVATATNLVLSARFILRNRSVTA